MATFDNRRAEAARDEEELLSSPRQSNRPLILAFVGLVLMLGLYIPPFLAHWYRAAAQLIGGP